MQSFFMESFALLKFYSSLLKKVFLNFFFFNIVGLFSISWHHLSIASLISSLFKKFFLAYPRISLNLPAEIQLFLHQYTICLKVLCAYFLFSCFMLLFFSQSLHIGFLPVLVIFGGILEKVTIFCFIFFLSLHSTYSPDFYMVYI